ncbi:hypothetical protein K438DRAFT_1785530 [Mycena galopus ATCC 62051]|nr:hypothetical protein K438DRAFT_1785530 [Mycena galopus ATCC 62051]
MSFHRVFEKIAEEMKWEAHVESGDCSTVSARNIHNHNCTRCIPRKIPLNDWLRKGLGSYQPQPMQKLLALISAVDSNLLDNIFVVTRAGNSIVFMKEYTALDFHAAREAAFHAFRHSLQGWQGRFLGAVHFTCDGWDVDSDELPDLVDWDA